MAVRQDDQVGDPSDESGSRISSVPLLGEGFSENANPTATSLESPDTEQEIGESLEVDSKTGKRRFWGLGKKKEDEKAKKKKDPTLAAPFSAAAPSVPTIRPASPMRSSRMTQASSSHHPTSHPYGAPASPSRNVHTSSPHVSSPASSQIFERNVQEDGLHASASPAIPAHITTENHIPPVLDASSAAITNDHLNPDNVEIVTHSAHQPAAVTVTGAGISEAAGGLWQDDLVAHPDNDDAASNYGALDANDVRRLSFISFADVVHAEHAEHADHSNNRDSVHLSGTSTIPPLAAFNRSPSPVRSPGSSHGLGGSPSLSGSASFQGLDTSSNYVGRGPGSPFSGHSPPTGGELTIETMRQALRKTGSGDLSGARSQPISAVGGDDGTAEHPFK
ncbi:hypothetical protein MMC07_006848 [Pseudocyphellaria aurata]|nr:hypothetical protein [Pseudocyphellaria aurata]